MTEEKKVYSVFEHPDLSFAKIPHEKGMTYEFELRSKASTLLAPLFKKGLKGDPLASDPSQKKEFTNPLFALFFDNSGHDFFNLSVKKDGKVAFERQIGFSAERNPSPEKKRQTAVGVPGAVYDQEKSNPAHHFSKTFELSRGDFDRLVGFIEKSIENPPPYIWPRAMNCTRFMKQCARAAGISASKISSVINLPVTTQIHLGVTKVAKNVAKAAEKIAGSFSSSRAAPVSEKGIDAGMKKVLGKKSPSR